LESGALAQGPAAPQLPTKSSFVKVSVMQRSEAANAPFRGVGLFTLFQGDSPFSLGKCPSRSNANGEVRCVMTCAPDDSSDTTLLLAPPGAEAVPGFEAPVAVEVALRGCSVEPQQVEFVYTPLRIALSETLSAAPELQRIVVPQIALKGGNPPPATFASIRPFADVQKDLEAYIAKNPGDPNAQRFSRLMRDAAVGGVPGLDASAARRIKEFSVGTQSIYLKSSASRALGVEPAQKLAPVTTDADQLRRSAAAVQLELARKPERAPSDIRLQQELRRIQHGPSGKAQELPAIEWNRVERYGAGPAKPGQ
jgi:hypothetical protein